MEYFFRKVSIKNPREGIFYSLIVGLFLFILLGLFYVFLLTIITFSHRIIDYG